MNESTNRKPYPILPKPEPEKTSNQPIVNEGKLSEIEVVKRDGETYVKQVNEEELKNIKKILAEEAKSIPINANKLVLPERLAHPSMMLRICEPSIFNEPILDSNVKYIGDTIAKYLENPDIEIEAKLGFLVERDSGSRLRLPIQNEVVLKHESFYRFRSDMAMDNHQKFNQLLNSEVRRTSSPNYIGSAVKYQHLYQTDVSYASSPKYPRVRATYLAKTKELQKYPISVVSKRNLEHINIYSPLTRLDFRISINQETKAELPPTAQETARYKDRLSYQHEIFSIDLTQVTPGRFIPGPGGQLVLQYESQRLHELEVEIVDPQVLRYELAKHRQRKPNQYYSLINIFLNNVRLLAKASNHF